MKRVPVFDILGDCLGYVSQSMFKHRYQADVEAHPHPLGFDVSCTKYCCRLANFRNKNLVSNFNFRPVRFKFRNCQLTTNTCRNNIPFRGRFCFKHVEYNIIIICLISLTVSVVKRSKALTPTKYEHKSVFFFFPDYRYI